MDLPGSGLHPSALHGSILSLLMIVFVYVLANCSSTPERQQEPETVATVATYQGPIVETLDESPEFREEVRKRTDAFAWRLNVTQKFSDYVRSGGMDDAFHANLIRLLNDKTDPGQEYADWLLVQRLAGDEIAKGNFIAAVELWEKNKGKFPGREHILKQLMTMLKDDDKRIESIRLPDEINSPSQEYLPVPELSGKRLYFTAKDRAGGAGGEDSFVSEMMDGKWRTARPLRELNTAKSDSIDSISADGTVLNIMVSGDEFFSQLGPTGWGPLKRYDEPVSTRYFEADIVGTPDGKALVFASDRPGGYFAEHPKDSFYGGASGGNTDLYITFLQEDGSYSVPRNLGPFINTPGAERTPFVHPDGKTLYFSSDGYDGFGGLDVYKSVRLDETWTHWSPPENVGKAINGLGDDWGFQLTAAADRVYVSRQSANTGSDIFQVVPIPIRARPAQAVMGIRGTVKDEAGNPLEASVSWEDLETNKSLGKLSSRADNGEFFIALPLGKEYGYFAQRKGFLNQSQRIDLRETQNHSEKEISIVLVSMKAAARDRTEIVLNNIFFSYNSDVLDARSHPELNRLAELMQANPEMKIELEGHTDNTGDPKYNKDLSSRRAKSVAAYIFTRGISPDRVVMTGYGSTKPVSENKTDAGRQKNRRVSFVLK